MVSPSRAVALFGTDEPSPPARRLTAGPLSVLLDAGQVRSVRIGGVEAIRGIFFLVRDERWGTYVPRLHEIDVEQGADAFTVTYRGVCSRDGAELTYEAHIEGRADGHLRFEATATPRFNFATNRAGFVVLHPLRGVAGQPVTLEHTDGSVEQARFPDTIAPHQPFFDLRAMTHEVSPGLSVRCVLEGDAFETEDQRNWGDASFKTYVRPLARPFPYILPAGIPVRQSVTLTFAGPLPSAAPDTTDEVRVVLGGEAGGVMPLVGVGLRPEDSAAVLERQALAAALGAQLIVGHYDPRAGHGADALARLGEVATAVGASLALEAVLPCEAAPEVELGQLAAKVRQTKIALEALAVSPAADLESGPSPAGLPSLEAIYAAARATFPHVRLGGGSFAYFTELNRKRPPADRLDFVTHTTCAIVHAADDVSVMETLETVPATARSARAFMGDAGYRVGPVALGMRQNPYGAGPAETDGTGRVAMARVDPRQRGLFGAAYLAGYAALLARADAEALTIGSLTGPFGVIATKQPEPRPFFDERPDPAVYPAYHVVRWLAQAAGRPLRSVGISDDQRVQAVAFRAEDQTILLLANLTPDSQRVRVEGLNGDLRVVALDETRFVAAVTAPLSFEEAGVVLPARTLTLPAYAVVRLTAGG